MTPTIRIGHEDFDPGEEVARLEAAAPGGVACFCGNVRRDGGVVALELEHYPGMTEAALAAIAGQAARRWPLVGFSLIHRAGRLEAGAHIVFVGAAAAHRAPALAAVEFAIDRIKTDAPFWKCEHLADGSARWVEACAEDEAARDRWDDA